jgi:hypothetical protein
VARIGSCAFLSDCGLIIGGHDRRGYLFYTTAGNDPLVDTPMVYAGCRAFEGFPEAWDHWRRRHIPDPDLHANVTGLVKMMRSMAKKRRWPAA